jgi:hypothetical protein
VVDSSRTDDNVSYSSRRISLNVGWARNNRSSHFILYSNGEGSEALQLKPTSVMPQMVLLTSMPTTLLHNDLPFATREIEAIDNLLRNDNVSRDQPSQKSSQKLANVPWSIISLVMAKQQTLILPKVKFCSQIGK